MTFSHSGSLTPRLLAAIGLSLAINVGTDIYSEVGSPQSNQRQLVLCLSLNAYIAPERTRAGTQKHMHNTKKQELIEAVTAPSFHLLMTIR